MTTTICKPTTAELDDAKQYYNDVNDYLEYLTDLIQARVNEYSEDSEDSDDDDDEEEELSPNVSQFLNDYKEYKAYISSLPQVHTQLSDPKPSPKRRSQLKRYSYPILELPPPDLLDIPQCETKLDRNATVSPSFATSLPVDGINEKKFLTNEPSPSVALLKAQLEKYSKEQEKNRIVIRIPTYSFDELVEERNTVFVIKKSTAVIVAPPIVAPPIVAEPPKEQEPIREIREETVKDSTTDDEKSIVNEITEKVSSKKKAKKNMIDFDFLSNFLSIAKVGFSRSQLSSLGWA